MNHCNPLILSYIKSFRNSEFPQKALQFLVKRETLCTLSHPNIKVVEKYSAMSHPNIDDSCVHICHFGIILLLIQCIT